jgi:Gas vesicle protein G
MGLIKELALLPVAPLRFTVWVAEQVDSESRRREGGPGAIARRIQDLEAARERGELSDEEAARLQGEAIEQQISRSAPAPKEGSQGD